MADEGATPRELILEACRRNNPDLLHETLSSLTSSKPHNPTRTSDLSPAEATIANLLNTSRDGWGNAPLHIAASSGAYEALDVLLDQPGVETDPLTRDTGETPLHKAVEYENSQWRPSRSQSGAEEEEDDEALFPIVGILLDAGCDPRIRSKAGRKPVDVVDARNEALKGFLRRAEVMLVEGEGIVDLDRGDEGGDGSESDNEIVIR